MEVTTSQEISGLLARWGAGDESALERLMPRVYAELKGLARRHLARERRQHTLEPTALVHEAYLRLAGGGAPARRGRSGDGEGDRGGNRVRFYAVAARLMRQVLVDHARSRGAAKRGGGVPRVALDEAYDRPAGGPTADLVALDDALAALEALDPRKSRIIELRYFGGLTLEETAGVIGIAVPTVVKEARLARAWLYDALTGDGREPSGDRA